MEEHTVKILETKWLTHDVKQLTVEKPKGYSFVPGQATEVAINKPEWSNERRPFTFTSLNSSPHLEFTIKVYDDHKGVTKQIGRLEKGDSFLIHDVWGAISYKGPGVFIAGGAGITPFISIFRQLADEKNGDKNVLLFSNKKKEDIILENELNHMPNLRVRNILTREKSGDYDQGHINTEYLKKVIPSGSHHFYVCGPEQFTADILKMCEERGARADALVFEK